MSEEICGSPAVGAVVSFVAGLDDLYRPVCDEHALDMIDLERARTVGVERELHELYENDDEDDAVCERDSDDAAVGAARWAEDGCPCGSSKVQVTIQQDVAMVWVVDASAEGSDLGAHTVVTDGVLGDPSFECVECGQRTGQWLPGRWRDAAGAEAAKLSD